MHSPTTRQVQVHASRSGSETTPRRSEEHAHPLAHVSRQRSEARRSGTYLYAVKPNRGYMESNREGQGTFAACSHSLIAPRACYRPRCGSLLRCSVLRKEDTAHQQRRLLP